MFSLFRGRGKAQAALEAPPTLPVVETAHIVRTWGDGFGTFATRCLQVLIVVTLASAAVVAGLALKTEVIAVLLALILACAFSPLVRLLVRLRLPRTLAALLTVVIAIGGLAGVLTLVGFAIAGQANQLATAAVKSADQVEVYLRNLGLPIEGNPGEQIVRELQRFIADSSVQHSALSGLGIVGEIGTGAVLLLFVLFFFLRDGGQIWRFLTRPLRGGNAARAKRIGVSTTTVLGSYARGTATIAFIDAVVIGLGLAFTGVPLALPLGVVVFLTAFIPIIGAPLAGILAAAVALVSQGPIIALVVIGIVIAVHLIEGNLLHPLIMSHAVSLHPLVVLLALTAGTILGGIVGAILAVPTASVVWAAIKAWRGEPVAAEGRNATVPGTTQV